MLKRKYNSPYFRGLASYHRKKRFKGSGGGGTSGFAPEGQIGASRRDRHSFRPSFSPWDGRLNQADRLRIKIRSFVSITLSSTSGGFATGYVGLNTLKAPFSNMPSSLSHTNPTINNLSTLFSRYRVTYAKLTASLSPLNASSNPSPMFVAMSAFDPMVNTVSITGLQQLTESRLGKFVICPVLNGYTGKPVTLSVKTSPAVVFGKSLVEMKDSQQEGNVTSAVAYADPGQIARFYLGWQANDAASSVSVSADLVLTQWVELYDRAQYA